MAMTSQQRYDLLKEMDRLGVTTGKNQKLLAAIDAGEISLAEALPPIMDSGNSMMTFGGSDVSSGSSPSLLSIRPDSQIDSSTMLQPSNTPTVSGGLLNLPPIVPDRPTTTVTPEEQLAAEQAAQQEMLQNEAFLALLQQLGLTGLINAYGQSSGVDVSQYLQPQYQAPVYQMNNMYQPKGMMTGQTFGVAPYRTGYLPPMVVPKSTVASDTGLLQYVMNQGQ